MLSFMVVVVKQSTFRAVLSVFGEKMDPKPPRSHFFSKKNSPKQISAQNSNFEQK